MKRDRTLQHLSNVRRSLMSLVAMTFVLLFFLVLFQMSMPTLSEAQQAPNVRVQLNQPLGPEPDIAKATLYVTNDCADTAGYGVAGEVTQISPLATDPADRPDPVVFEYSFYAPPDQETEKCFVTTFTDTSGNESGTSEQVRFRVDKLPPGVPVGLTAVDITLSQ